MTSCSEITGNVRDFIHGSWNFKSVTLNMTFRMTQIVGKSASERTHLDAHSHERPFLTVMRPMNHHKSHAYKHLQEEVAIGRGGTAVASENDTHLHPVMMSEWG
jgi:hypothetical protein